MIEGIESFREYDNPMWHLYSGRGVAVWDFTDPELPMSGYDLVLMIDSLEHVDPERGRPLLQKIVERNRNVIVSVPNGRMDQGETYGNPLEAHLWTFNGVEEFSSYDFRIIHRSVCTVVSIRGKLT